MFVKSIEHCDTNMVIAKIHDKVSGKRVGLKFFMFPFGGLTRQRRFNNAHAWADRLIEDLNREAVDLTAIKTLKNGIGVIDEPGKPLRVFLPAGSTTQQNIWESTKAQALLPADHGLKFEPGVVNP